MDPEETEEQQRERIQRCVKLGNEQLLEERIAEISVDSVLQTRSRLCDGKVDGPDDRLVSEMLKRLPFVKNLRSGKCLTGALHGKEQASDSWKIVQLVTRGGCDCWDCTHCWEYIDDEGVQRGPSTNSEMRDWWVTQKLPKNINIRRCDAGVSANRKRGGHRQVAFRLLKDRFKDARRKRVLLLSERKNG